jgi:elongation factor 1-beta
MAQVIITFRIMPDSPDSDLKAIELKVTEAINRFGGEVGRVEIKPVAFGLKAIELIFVADEAKGGTDDLESEISGFDDITSVEVIDCRRAIG